MNAAEWLAQLGRLDTSPATIAAMQRGLDDAWHTLDRAAAGRRRSCIECGDPAVWWWMNSQDVPVPLCDDHAASRDLSDLSEIAA